MRVCVCSSTRMILSVNADVCVRVGVVVCMYMCACMCVRVCMHVCMYVGVLAGVWMSECVGEWLCWYVSG